MTRRRALHGAVQASPAMADTARLDLSNAPAVASDRPTKSRKWVWSRALSAVVDPVAPTVASGLRWTCFGVVVQGLVKGRISTA